MNATQRTTTPALIRAPSFNCIRIKIDTIPGIPVLTSDNNVHTLCLRNRFDRLVWFLTVTVDFLLQLKVAFICQER